MRKESFILVHGALGGDVNIFWMKSPVQQLLAIGLSRPPEQLEKNELAAWTLVARSVLNYGTRDLAGVTSDNLDAMELERQFRDAIIAFEPRIVPDSLQVRMVQSDRTEIGRVGFEIKGHLWALPHPERIFFRTDIDLESGICDITSGA